MPERRRPLISLVSRSLSLVAQGKMLTTKIDKTKSWPQPVRPMPPIGLIDPICENLQSVNLTTPLCRAHRGDQFPYLFA
jgi:hypothetical protein